MDNKDRTIALVGNPNVGKSVIFNRLTGQYAIVSNYPGTTIDVSRGVALFSGQRFQVIDTPGTNSLIPVSEDEQVTRDLLFRETPDVVVQVGDAKNLNRTLLLTMELAELGIPMVLVLNMWDEALERGIRTDLARLEHLLGVPVTATVATTGNGMGDLKKLILNARVPTVRVRYSKDLERLAAGIEERLAGKVPFPRSLALMLVSAERNALQYAPAEVREDLDRMIDERIAKVYRNPKFLVFGWRNGTANETAGEVQSVAAGATPTWLARLGRLSMQPFPGYLIALLVLFVMYEFVGVFAAGVVVDFMETTVFGRYVVPFTHDLVYRLIPWQAARDFLVGEYGMVTMALTYAVGIIFPIVGAFFLFFGVLEDSGYLPRLSAMLDRAFRGIGLNGKAVLPMILGFGCGTMATMTSRILETKKERLLVILLLSLAIPCSAQLGVILGMLAGLSWKVTLLWILSVSGSLALVGFFANKLIPGGKCPFIMEIPPLRRPVVGNLLLKVKMRLVWYMKEAVPLFALASAILFFADRFRVLPAVERAARPLVGTLLGLPAQVTEVFIMGFLRRDYGAAGLYQMSQSGLLDPVQVLVSAVTITLFVPCIAQFFMTVREKGWKAALAIMAFVIGYAFLFGGALNIAVRTLRIL